MKKNKIRYMQDGGEVTETTSVPDYLKINPIVLTEDVVDTFRKTFDNPSEALARDIVATLGASDYSYIDNFNYDALTSGRSPFLDLLPSRQGVTDPREKALSNEEIIRLFTNAGDAPFMRPFLGEAGKSAAATYAFMKATGETGKRLIPSARALPRPLAGPAVIGSALASGAAGLAAAAGVYMAGDEIEEQILGPDPVVTPSQRAVYEAYRTLGAFSGGIFAPWMLSPTASATLGTRQWANNLPNPTLGDKISGALGTFVGTGGATARAAPRLTAAAEAVAAGGATLGAYSAERSYPGQVLPRVGAELVGANTLAATVMRLLPRIVSEQASLDAARAGDALVTRQQRNLFNNINELYEDFGSPEQYDELIKRLTSPEMTRQLEEAFPGVEFTAAQRSGDPLLMAVEAAKTGGSRGLDAARQRAERQSYEFINNYIQGLISQGDPNSLQQAAALRQSVFTDSLQTNLQRRVNDVIEANERLKALPGQPGFQSPEQLSVKLDNILEEVIAASSAKSRKLWGEVENVPIIQPLGPNATDDQLPAFLKMWNEISLKDPALQREFERAVPQITDFVNTARRDLGVNPLPQFSEAELANIARYQGQVENALIKLDGAPEGQSLLNRISDEAQALPLGEQAAFFRSQSQKVLQESGQAGDIISRRDRGRISSALDSMADLASVKSTAETRAAARGAEATESLTAIDSQRLTEARSRMLDVARGFAANPETRDFGRRIGMLAESILDDLDVDGFGEAYDVARAYTRAYNDTFGRTIVGPSAATTRAGGRRLPPEVLFQTYVKSNPGVTLSRVRQLQDAAEWADSQGLSTYSDELAAGGEPVFSTVNNLVDSYLRNLRKVASREVFDPRTGETRTVINAQALDDYKRDNAELLELFPQLKIDLADAASAQRTLDVFKATEATANKINRGQRYLSQLIGGTSPTVAVTEAFNAENPVRAFNNLFALRRMGADTLRLRRMRANRESKILGSELTESEVNDALQTAMLEFAYLKAGGEGAFNPQVFYKTLFEPLPNNPRTSLMDIADNYGVVSNETRNRLRFMSEQMSRVQAADAAGRLNDPDFAAEAGPILDFYVGVLGSAAGSRAFGAMGGTGPGVIAASGAGSRQLREILLKLPAAKRLEAIDMVFTDPALTAALMRRPKSATPQATERLYDRIIGLVQERFLGVGLTGQPTITRTVAEDQDLPGLPEDEARTIQQLRERMEAENEALLNQQSLVVPPAQLPTQGGGAVPSPVPLGSAVAQRPAIQSSGPVDRARFAALFPEDRELIQGIGSLRTG